MKWIKFKNKHPEEHVGVLITDGKIISAASVHYIDKEKKNYFLMPEGIGGYEWEWDFDNTESVTHWVPMPKLPSK